ncbi:MAG: hypothetical protein KGH73_02490, partial [Xanthomonadaceae bacterium]|nr:hypothetical protein [Xanthomonadaceae bacterium]
SNGMRRRHRGRVLRLLAAASLVAQLAATNSLAASPVRPVAPDRIATLADMVRERGRDGALPPHLALALGVGRGEAVPVKQAVLRHGPEVRVFNVCVGDPDELVILRTNEMRRTTHAYLLGRDGKLRKTVYFRAGGQPSTVPSTAARGAFAAELRFWRHPH